MITARGVAVCCCGGAAARTSAFAPNRLLRSGAIGGAVATATTLLPTSAVGTRTATRDTGWALTIAVLGTAMTAPGTFWFAYRILLALLMLFTLFELLTLLLT